MHMYILVLLASAWVLESLVWKWCWLGCNACVLGQDALACCCCGGGTRVLAVLYSCGMGREGPLEL